MLAATVTTRLMPTIHASTSRTIKTTEKSCRFNSISKKKKFHNFLILVNWRTSIRKSLLIRLCRQQRITSAHRAVIMSLFSLKHKPRVLIMICDFTMSAVCASAVGLRNMMNRLWKRYKDPWRLKDVQKCCENLV